MIISIEEAYDKLNTHHDVVFVDCRFDLQDASMGKRLFEEQHIKQAIYLDLEKHLSGEVKETGGRHPLPHIDTFIKTLATKGISKETTVIAYDNNRAFASRFYWMMKYIGHENIFLLNGGLNDWKDKGYPTESGEEKVNNKELYGSFEVQSDLIANQELVKSNINSATVCIIDSRNYDRYIGKHEPIDKKAGHIPSAKNYEWTNVCDENGRFKSPEALVKYFEPLSAYDELIVYCGSGVTATPNVIALWHAGFNNVKLYVGSFSDWIKNDNNEVETTKG
ncbi:sulfurtransferase [Bacillaceae bacterium W0354]